MTEPTRSTGTDATTPDDDLPAFGAPWQARAFALAVTVTDEEDLRWDAFQSQLVAEIEANDRSDAEPRPLTANDAETEARYYQLWLGALERLLVEDGLLDPGELDDRIAAFETGDRSAHEFVRGDPHAHTDRLPDGHADGSTHSHADHDHPD